MFCCDGSRLSAALGRPRHHRIAVNRRRCGRIGARYQSSDIGGNCYFRERRIDVYGHIRIQRTEEEFRAEKSEFTAAISNTQRRAHEESEVFYWATQLPNPNRPISQDSRMDLGNCDVQILLTPGHTPSNMSVYVSSEGILYCGDCLVNGYLPNLDAGRVNDWLIWLNSLDRIADLAPQVIVPGTVQSPKAAKYRGSLRTFARC